MPANYGYSDGSGSYYIAVDTDKCNGCGDCVTACPSDVFEVLDEDPNDPLRDDPVVIVRDDKRNKLKSECGSCKPSEDRPALRCVEACRPRALSHSW